MMNFHPDKSEHLLNINNIRQALVRKFLRKKHYYLTYIGPLLCSLIITGCTSSKSVPVTPPATQQSGSTLNKLNGAYQKWAGTPYQLGGTTHSGMDCSGLVYMVFVEEFGTYLPRTTEAQVALGKRINKSQLRAGDLVFFKTGYRSRHVGIYLSNNQFLHASTSKGVIISDLNNPYWADAYWQARRI